MLRVQILHLLFELLWKHAELERRSAHQLRLKVVEMLQSSTQLAKNHRDDLGLGYLWNGKQFESNGEKCRIWRTTRNLSPSACYRETDHCSLDSFSFWFIFVVPPTFFNKRLFS